MFACIFGRSVSAADPSKTEEPQTVLADLAFTFSPLVEQVADNTVVLDIAGQDLMFGLPAPTDEIAGEAEINSAQNLAIEIARRARQLNLKVNVAVAANPDAAIHLARSFKGPTIVKVGEELFHLGPLSLKKLDYSLARIDAHRAGEIRETLALWGMRTFGDLARLPLAGVAERLGQEGVRLQKLAHGKSDRSLNLIRPPIGFAQSLELEHPVAELEPLSFILSRLLNQLCANLLEHALATNEIRLRLVTEPQFVGIAAGLNADANLQEVNGRLHQRTITFPVPMRNPKTLLRLLLLDIEAHPPCAPIVAVSIEAEPVKPRAAQTGLFIPLAPEAERLEITLARLAKLVGADNIGSPELLDTHRPDAFSIKRFRLPGPRKKVRSNPQSAIRTLQCLMGFRVFRPPWLADVHTRNGRPVRINARAHLSGKVRGQIVCASGPWRTSGDWWRADVWARDEWDVAVSDPASQEREVLCRIFRDLANEQWFLAGIYD
jgi:protein ImuB